MKPHLLSFIGGSTQQLLNQVRPQPGIPVFRQQRNVDQRKFLVVLVDQQSADWLIVAENNLVVSFGITRVVLLALQIELHSDQRLYLRLVRDQKFEFLHSDAGKEFEEKIFVSSRHRAHTDRRAGLDIESFVVQTEISLMLKSLSETTERC